MIKLTINFDKPFRKFGQPAVEKVIAQADRALKPAKEWTINVRVTSAHQVRAINKKYAGINKSTDVLSFNYSEGPASPIDQKQGDIVISHPQLLKQAAEAKYEPANELALLILHGVMHVLGFDHQTDVQQANFEQMQSQIIESAGLKSRPFTHKPAE